MLGRSYFFLVLLLGAADPVQGQAFGGSFTSSWFAEDDLGRLNGFSVEASYKRILIAYSKVEGEASERGSTCVGFVFPDDFCPDEPIRIDREAAGLRFGYRFSLVEERILWLELIPTLGVTDAAWERRGQITGRVQEDHVDYIDFGVAVRLGAAHESAWLPHPLLEMVGFALAGGEAEQCVDCFVGPLAGNSYRLDGRLGLEWRF